MGAEGQVSPDLRRPQAAALGPASSSTTPRRCCGRSSPRSELTANAVYGFFPANTDGDDIVIYTDESRTDRTDALPDAAPAVGARRPDLVPIAGRLRRPARVGLRDYLGAFAVTAGLGLESLVDQFERDHDDYNAIMSKALADRLAEALAEMLHKKARDDWGYGRDERPDNRRPDRGEIPRHPAGLGLPEFSRPHREARLVATCWTSRQAAGIVLTETYAMYPGASVSGFYFAHPEARYFAVDFITRDQVENYAARKGDAGQRGRTLAGAEPGL